MTHASRVLRHQLPIAARETGRPQARGRVGLRRLPTSEHAWERERSEERVKYGGGMYSCFDLCYGFTELLKTDYHYTLQFTAVYSSHRTLSEEHYSCMYSYTRYVYSCHTQDTCTLR